MHSGDKKTSRRKILKASLGLSLASLAGIEALANAPQPWPAKPIRLIVPGGAGSGTDIMARLFSTALAKSLGQPVVVENKPGANGLLGNNIAAKSPADGYTLLLSHASAVSVNAATRTSPAYEPLKELSPVLQISSGGVALVTNAGVPARNLDELVAYVKANPDIAYGTFGVGSTGHLAMEAIAHGFQLKMRHIPYKTSVQLLTDLQSGLVKVGFVDARSCVPFIKEGRLTAIAMTGSKRGPTLPQVRTLTEQGFRFDMDGWYGFFVPQGTSSDIVEKLNAEMTRVVQTPEVQQVFKQLDVVFIGPNKPQQFAAVIQNDIRMWRKVVVDAKIQVN